MWTENGASGKLPPIDRVESGEWEVYHAGAMSRSERHHLRMRTVGRNHYKSRC